MNDIGLIPYVMYITRRGRKQSYVNINDFGGKYSARALLVDFLDNLLKKKHESDEDLKRTFHLHSYREDGNSIYGTIIAGYYDSPGSIIDSETGATKYIRIAKGAEARSYFFYIETPSEAIGEFLIIMQAYDFDGVKTEFSERMKEHFKTYVNGEMAANYTISFEAIVPSDYIRSIAEKIKIKKLRFIKNGGRMSIGSESSKPVNIEVRVSPPSRQVLPVNSNLIAYINGNIKSIRGIFSLPEGFGDFEYTDIKLEGKINGRSRTISIRDLRLPKFSYPVDKDTLLYDTEQYILPGTLIGYADDIVSSLRSEMAPRGPVPEDEQKQE